MATIVNKHTYKKGQATPGNMKQNSTLKTEGGFARDKVCYESVVLQPTLVVYPAKLG